MLNLNKNIHIAYFISSISLLSLIYALVSGENSIGGAVNDYFYHEKYCHRELDIHHYLK